MSKNKEYSSDVHQKLVEQHKIESGCKKIAKKLKILILTIRAYNNKLQPTKDVTNLPRRGHVSILP